MSVVDEPLLTIGAFASAVGLTPSALRYYDECGLLLPAEVDVTTGYRYYTPDLADRARLVVGMREAGVPIETMRLVLDGPAAEAQKALREFLDAEALRRARAEEALGEVLDQVAYAAEAPPEPVSPARFSVDGPVLAAALRQVRAAADSDPASPLAAVLVDVADGAVDVVATNRYWMAVRTLPVEGAGGEGRAVLELRETVELARVLDTRCEVPVELSGGELHISGLAWGSAGAYPAHRIVLGGLPRASTRVVVPTAELIAAVAVVRHAHVDLEITEDRILVAAPAARPDARPDAVPAEAVAAAVTGAPVGLRMNAVLLGRALDAAVGDTAIIELAAPNRPVRIRSPYQPGFRAVVMPISRAEDG